MAQQFTLTPLESITLSKTNPRKHFDKEQLEELAESIKLHGVLQPILVRPNGKKLEVVVGERRFRASKKAKMKHIPTITRNLTDEEAVELQLIENLQREDLTAIEEANGYQYMIDKLEYTADTLAEKIGKSRAYIYGRIKLTSLCDKGYEAMEEGVISASVGLLIARIPGEKNQEEALGEIVEGNYWDSGTMTYREAKEHIEEHFMIRLKGSPFSQKDAELLPEAGPCTTCPKRTGNQKELYPNASADVCTDPQCYREKEKLHHVGLADKAKAKGNKVLSGKEAEKHMSYGSVQSKSLVALSAKNYNDNKYRSYQELLGKQCPEVTMIQTDSGFVPTVKKSEADQIIQKKYKWARDAKAEKEKQKEREKKLKAKEKVQTDAFKQAVLQVADKAKTLVLTDEYWLFLAKAIVNTANYSADAAESVVKRRGIDFKKAKSDWGSTDWKKALITHLEKCKGGELRSLIAEFLLRQSKARTWEGKLTTTYLDACKIYGVDRKQLEADVKKATKKKATKKQPLLGK